MYNCYFGYFVHAILTAAQWSKSCICTDGPVSAQNFQDIGIYSRFDCHKGELVQYDLSVIL